ncbi:MAG: hypothetical protein ACK5RG_12785 [Cyclobacteriaceae bacterium]|jgi:hypothetical protein|nr:hypothetical protein [Flammeovirgaceae bacterium]
MKKGLSITILKSFIVWVLLIQIINISIDPLDPVSDKLGRFTLQEDLSINEIESIYEFVSEQCLGVDIPENDEDDENGFVKIMDFYFAPSCVEIKSQYQSPVSSFFTKEQRLTSISLDLTSPPPKLA